MALAVPSPSTFFRLQSDYLFPVTYKAWQTKHELMRQHLRQQTSVSLIGDARCNSPGYSAKYCTYTLMDSATNKIVDFWGRRGVRGRAFHYSCDEEKENFCCWLHRWHDWLNQGEKRKLYCAQWVPVVSIYHPWPVHTIKNVYNNFQGQKLLECLPMDRNLLTGCTADFSVGLALLWINLTNMTLHLHDVETWREAFASSSLVAQARLQRTSSRPRMSSTRCFFTPRQWWTSSSPRELSGTSSWSLVPYNLTNMTLHGTICSN